MLLLVLLAYSDGRATVQRVLTSDGIWHYPRHGILHIARILIEWRFDGIMGLWFTYGSDNAVESRCQMIDEDWEINR